LKLDRSSRWMAFLLLTMSGCGPEIGRRASSSNGSAGASGGVQATSNNTVQFSLTPGETVPIYISLAQAANVNIAVRDSNGSTVQTVALINFPMGNDFNLFGLCGIGDGCSGSQNGTASLPSGTYTAQIFTAGGNPPQVGCLSAPTAATRTVTIHGNLDQTARPPGTFLPDNPSTTSNFNTSMTVLDALGRAIQLNIYFCKAAPDATETGDSGDWVYHAMTDGGNLETEGDGTTPATLGKATEVATGALRFDDAGRLISNVLSGTESFVPKGATKTQPLAFHFGSGTASGGNGLDGLAQYAATSAISFVSQDGAGAHISCVSSEIGTSASTGADGRDAQSTSSDPFAATSDITISLLRNSATPTLVPARQWSACVCANVNAHAGTSAPPVQHPSSAPSDPPGNISLFGNLDYASLSTVFDPADPQNTSSFNTITTVSDSRGNTVQLTLYFSKNDEANTEAGDSGDWTYTVTTDSGNLATDAMGTPLSMAGTLTVVAMGTLRFDSSGALVSNTTILNGFNPKGGTKPQALEFNFGTGTALGGSGLDGLTQYTADSTVTSLPQEQCSLAVEGINMNLFRCSLVSWYL